MELENRPKKEYGGFLPLELNDGEELFAKYEPNLLRFNSVKASLDYIIRKLNKKRIFIPYYYCPSTSDAIERVGIEVLYYHIDNNLLPIDLPDENNSIVLLVDYFGVRSKEVDELAQKIKNAHCIIDRAHSFFVEPIISDRIHVVYSAKKFLGVPDGSYLVSRLIKKSEIMLSNSTDYAEYLFSAYEKGTNATYNMKKQSDDILSANYRGMSYLSLGLLKNVDYSVVEERRKQNFAALRGRFADINELFIPEECAAYQFPLLISEEGTKVKKYLIQNRIYVSTLWSGQKLINNGNEFELNMSNNAVYLPIDQRYDMKDMDYLVSIICKFLGNIK